MIFIKTINISATGTLLKNKYTTRHDLLIKHIFMKIIENIQKGHRPSSVVRRRPSVVVVVRLSSVVRRRPSSVVVRRPSSVVVRRHRKESFFQK